MIKSVSLGELIHRHVTEGRLLDSGFVQIVQTYGLPKLDDIYRDWLEKHPNKRPERDVPNF